MSSFVEECRKLFGTADLYAILHLHHDTSGSATADQDQGSDDGPVPATSSRKTKQPSVKRPKHDDAQDDEERKCDGSHFTQAQLKKAYYRASMVWHPDRLSGHSNANREVATRKFQVLGRVYGILGDKDKRALYDETGAIDDENVLCSDDGSTDWADRWRAMFKKVTEEDIKKFEKEYRGSDQEREDVQRSYVLREGDMNKVMEDIMVSTYEDEPRFSELIRQMIKDETVPAFDKFTNEAEKSKRMRRQKAAKEEKEAEAALAELKERHGANSSLESMIAMRQQQRQLHVDKFCDDLANKYAGSKKKKGDKKK